MKYTFTTEAQIDIEPSELIHDYLIDSTWTDDEIKVVVLDYLSGLDDCYYYADNFDDIAADLYTKVREASKSIPSLIERPADIFAALSLVENGDNLIGVNSKNFHFIHKLTIYKLRCALNSLYFGGQYIINHPYEN